MSHMAYAVYTTEKFDKEVKKFSEEEQNRIKKIFFQIRNNPYVGDQLRYRLLRETSSGKAYLLSCL